MYEDTLKNNLINACKHGNVDFIKKNIGSFYLDSIFMNILMSVSAEYDHVDIMKYLETIDYDGDNSDEDIYSDTPTAKVSNSKFIPVVEAKPILSTNDTNTIKKINVNDSNDPNEYIKDLSEKRKSQSTQLILELLNEFFFVSDKKALHLLFKCFSHVVLEYSDIDWNSVASVDSNGTPTTLNMLLIKCKYTDVLSVFLDNDLIDPCVPDITGKSLENMVKDLDLNDYGYLKFAHTVNAKVLEKNKSEISTLKDICAESK